MRYVCVDCAREMRCMKTGCDVIWNGCVVARADQHACPDCGNSIRVVNDYTMPYDPTRIYELSLYVGE